MKDFRIEAPLVNGYKDGQLSLDIRMTAPEKGQRISVKVLDRDNEIYKSEYSLRSVSDTLVRFDKYVANVRPWNAETPNIYTLVVTHLDASGTQLESFTHPFGFRTVEMNNGRQLINGKAVLFKGVNRHEHDAHKGRTVSVSSMLEDIRLDRKSVV